MDIDSKIKNILKNSKIVTRQNTFPIVIPGKYLTKQNVEEMYSIQMAEEYDKLTDKSQFIIETKDKYTEFFAFDGKVYNYLKYC